MKTYIKSKLPKISIFLIAILFVSNILTFIIPTLSKFFVLYPSNLHEPFNWYRLITYPLYVGGLLAWIYNSLIIILTGFIIENKLKTKNMISLILLSSIIGGLTYIIINQGETNNIPIAAPSMISWGYWSATIIIGIRYWRTLNLFEKLVMILCILSTLSIINIDFGFFIGQLAVIFTIALLTILKLLNQKTSKIE